MHSTGRTGRGAARLLVLLAVVLGLLGMHGLASTHHAAAAHVVSAVAAPVDEPVPQRPDSLHQHRHAASGTADPAPGAAWLLTAAGAAVPACDDDCPSGVAVLCAAVLAAVVAAACLPVVTARRREPVAAPRGGPRDRVPGAARLLLLGPDPVAELCVSRT